MRKRWGRTISAATITAVALSGATAFAGSDGRDDERDDRGGRKGSTYATLKFPEGGTLVLFGAKDARSVPLEGLNADEKVVGIDLRPATGALYGVSDGATDRVFTIDPATGQTANHRNLTVALSGTFFGADFNPSVDRLRIVSDAEQNLRTNVDDGATITDTPLAYPAGDRNAGKNPAIGAVGYTFAPMGGPTALYDVDSSNDTGGPASAARPDTFTLQNPPNGGGLQSIGPVGVDLTAQGGFDIAGKETFTALGFYQQGSVAKLYEHRFDRNGRVEETRVGLRGSYHGFAVLDAYAGR